MLLSRLEQRRETAACAAKKKGSAIQAALILAR